jgi:hypothetical protein
LIHVKTGRAPRGMLLGERSVIMKVNSGPFDRSLRIVAGYSLLAAMTVLEGDARWLGLIGIVPLLSGILGYCPLYQLFGWSTGPLDAYKR